jgi:hypothetical protein
MMKESALYPAASKCREGGARKQFGMLRAESHGRTRRGRAVSVQSYIETRSRDACKAEQNLLGSGLGDAVSESPRRSMSPLVRSIGTHFNNLKGDPH